jgi:hypothetical protein
MDVHEKVIRLRLVLLGILKQQKGVTFMRRQVSTSLPLLAGFLT